MRARAERLLRNSVSETEILRFAPTRRGCAGMSGSGRSPTPTNDILPSRRGRRRESCDNLRSPTRHHRTHIPTFREPTLPVRPLRGGGDCGILSQIAKATTGGQGTGTYFRTHRPSAWPRHCQLHSVRAPENRFLSPEAPTEPKASSLALGLLFLGRASRKSRARPGRARAIAAHPSEVAGWNPAPPDPGEGARRSTVPAGAALARPRRGRDGDT